MATPHLEGRAARRGLTVRVARDVHVREAAGRGDGGVTARGHTIIQPHLSYLPANTARAKPQTAHSHLTWMSRKAHTRPMQALRALASGRELRGWREGRDGHHNREMSAVRGIARAKRPFVHLPFPPQVPRRSVSSYQTAVLSATMLSPRHSALPHARRASHCHFEATLPNARVIRGRSRRHSLRAHSVPNATPRDTNSARPTQQYSLALPDEAP
jgi:hypothetical protein